MFRDNEELRALWISWVVWRSTAGLCVKRTRASPFIRTAGKEIDLLCSKRCRF